MLTVVAALLLCSAARATAFLSRLDAALGPHDFVLHVAEGGAATLRSATTGELLSTVSSSFSEHSAPLRAVHAAGSTRFGLSGPTAHATHSMPTLDTSLPAQNSHAVRCAFGCLPTPQASHAD